MTRRNGSLAASVSSSMVARQKPVERSNALLDPTAREVLRASRSGRSRSLSGSSRFSSSSGSVDRRGRRSKSHRSFSPGPASGRQARVARLEPLPPAGSSRSRRRAAPGAGHKHPRPWAAWRLCRSSPRASPGRFVTAAAGRIIPTTASGSIRSRPRSCPLEATLAEPAPHRRRGDVEPGRHWRRSMRRCGRRVSAKAAALNESIRSDAIANARPSSTAFTRVGGGGRERPVHRRRSPLTTRRRLRPRS